RGFQGGRRRAARVRRQEVEAPHREAFQQFQPSFDVSTLVWRHRMSYGATSMTSNEPGRIGGRAPSLAGVPYFAVGRKRWWVVVSRAMVRAPRAVCTVATTSCGGLPLTIVITPWPAEAKARCFSGSYAPPSTPAPIGGVARVLPVSVSTTAMVFDSLQVLKRWWFFTSIARPLGSSQWSTFQVE